ncbi:MAG: hypothetical protein AB1330_01455 [Bacillota bacterium]
MYWRRIRELESRLLELEGRVAALESGVKKAPGAARAVAALVGNVLFCRFGGGSLPKIALKIPLEWGMKFIRRLKK